MPKKYTLIDSKGEGRLIRRRVFIAGIMIGLLMLTLVLRIFYLQGIMHDHYITLSQHNRVKIQPIPPIRGLIFSKDNVLLADNRPSFSLEVIPERVDNLEKIIAKLSGIIRIDDVDIERFYRQLKKKRRFEGVSLRFNLSDEEVAKVSVNRHRFEGVDIVPRLNRYYPLGENFSHVIGYVSMIDEDDLKQLNSSNYSATTHMGKLGIERAYEDLLHGKVGYQQVEVNAQGRVIRVLDRTPPEAGKNLYLTVDVTLQNLAVESMDGRRGAIVAIDPNDGNILTLVSTPGYDPNLFVNGIDKKSYQRLLSSEDIPLLNRALQGKYPPGSTVKPFFALAALNEGVKVQNDETWCPGFFTLPGRQRQYRDWKKQGHGHTNMLKAIAQSCDVYFYNLAVEMGVDRLEAALKQFGFGQKTGIDIVGESDGLVPGRAWKIEKRGQVWFPGETVIMGIGQGYILTTPIQLAVATSKLANHGTMHHPHLLDKVQGSLSSALTEYSLKWMGRPIAMNETVFWDQTINAMVEVMHGPRGTARRSGLGANYRFAGKTGTVQVIGIPQEEEELEEEREIPEKFKDHALFIAFAPVEDPKIAIAIIVENGGSGSSTAAPIARRLLDHYLNDKTEAEKKTHG